jgi:hypothetical protein
MNHFSPAIFSAMTMTVVVGCSSADPSTSQAVQRPSHVYSAPAPWATSATLTVPDAGQADPDAALAALGDSTVLAKLRALALKASAIAGVPSPVTAVAVAASDHQAAETVISGATINDHAPVYVVQLTGGPFTATQHPPNVSAPQGDVLTVTIDATTYRVTDIGYDPVAPDLSQIGLVRANLLAQ